MKTDVNVQWRELTRMLKEKFGKQMTLESILFLIGLRELGANPREFSKEEKVDLMHIAVCRLLSQSGYYKLSHLDQDGWPHWELIKALPHADMFSQVHILREHIINYFEEEAIL